MSPSQGEQDGDPCGFSCAWPEDLGSPKVSWDTLHPLLPVKIKDQTLVGVRIKDQTLVKEDFRRAGSSVEWGMGGS